MTSFQSLPSELLVPIFKSLSRSDLRSLSSVSPYFREVAQSWLYAKIELWWDATYTPCILSLLLAIVRRPELAQHVHELVLDGNQDFYYNFKRSDKYDLIKPPQLSLDKIPDVDIQALLLVFPTFASPNDKQRWVEGLEQGSMDAFVTLLISLLPQLQSIKILNSFAKEVNILGSFLRAALIPDGSNRSAGSGDTRSSSALRRVQNITYSPATEGTGGVYPYDPSDILAWFYLPGLREMSAWLSNPAHFSWPSTRPPDATGLVKLHTTRVREHNLEPILRQTTRLESFHWTWSWDEYGESALQSEVIDFEKFFQALSHVRGTLKDLTMRVHLNPYRRSWDFIPPFTIHGSMGPLKEYTNLCSVGANPAFFLGFLEYDQPEPGLSMSDVLPSSVEKVTFYYDLRVSDYDPWTWPMIVQMVKDWLDESLQDTPLLRDVHLHTTRCADGPGWSQRALDELSKIGKGFRVRFKEVSGAMTHELVLELQKNQEETS